MSEIKKLSQSVGSGKWEVSYSNEYFDRIEFISSINLNGINYRINLPQWYKDVIIKKIWKSGITSGNYSTYSNLSSRNNQFPQATLDSMYDQHNINDYPFLWRTDQGSFVDGASLPESTLYVVNGNSDIAIRWGKSQQYPNLVYVYIKENGNWKGVYSMGNTAAPESYIKNMQFMFVVLDNKERKAFFTSGRYEYNYNVRYVNVANVTVFDSYYNANEILYNVLKGGDN